MVPLERTEVTVSAAALASGQPATGRSLRLHRPRGGYCGAGWCDQCGVDPATGHALCETRADTTGVRRRDLLRPLGRIAETQVPWFWERRMLRPRALRGAFLSTLSRLSSAPNLPPASGGQRPVHRQLEVATLHVGDPAHADPDAFIIDRSQGRIAFGIYGERTLGASGHGEVLEIHFERLVLATGAYLRLPPILGTDLPGVVSLDALRHYLAQGADFKSIRLAAVAPADQHDQIQSLTDGRLRLIDVADRLPDRIVGRGRVQGICRGGRTLACDAVVLAIDQPAIELALMAGARGALSDTDLPVVVATDLPAWLELRGRASAAPTAMLGCTADPDAFACVCEDVRIRDLAMAVADGFNDVELIKRRTGVLTGPCQGKLCQGTVLTALRGLGVPPRTITPRPFALPPRLAELADGHV